MFWLWERGAPVGVMWEYLINALGARDKVFLKRVLEGEQQLPLGLYCCFCCLSFWVSGVGVLLGS